jgi:UDP-N-acetylmuramoyl-tripeptide--D-alanyl-D-alanine ligase
MKTEQLYEIFRKSTGVTTDSRSIQKNQMFFALHGENFNGNKFASDAIKAGAICAVIDDPAYSAENTIVVENTLAELQALAGFYRKKLNIPVLGITGTNGKTTTKELTAAVLSRKYKLHYTKGNLNNHIGVPITILSAPGDTQFLIIEMGANHVGEIADLCRIAEPDYGLISNIGTAHIEGFGSYEGVIKTKTELYRHLNMIDGIAFYNDADTLLTEKANSIVRKTVPYSDISGKHFTLEEIPSGMNLVLKATYGNETHTIKTNLFGKYNYWNIKAAMATGLYFGVKLTDVADAIMSYVPANNRSQVRATEKNTLVCDSYNANPSSMHQAIESFAALDAEKKMVILGDMFELGEKSASEHQKIVNELINIRFSDVLLAGNEFSLAAAGTHFRTFANSQSLIDYLKKDPPKGCTILIKGSRGMGLERTYEFL